MTPQYVNRNAAREQQYQPPAPTQAQRTFRRRVTLLAIVAFSPVLWGATCLLMTAWGYVRPAELLLAWMR